MKWSLLYLACFFICTGYGITFAAFGIMIGLMDISGAWVGFNAALPAMGWIIGSLLIPFLQLKFGVHIKNIAISFLVVAIAGVFIPFASTDYLGLSVTRLIFGGAMGAFLRCIEYIIVANTSSNKRGRFLAFYGVTFLVGLIVGSLIQPIFAAGSLVALVAAAVLFTLGLLVFCFVHISRQPVDILPENQSSIGIFPILPIAFLGVFTYAMYESVPAYLLQVFTMRSGLGENIAAYTLSAAALGNLLLVFPILALSDRIGRVPVLAVCALTAFLVPIGLLQSLGNLPMFLLMISLLGASAGVTYGLSLAQLGDKFTQSALIKANALFGVVYAVGSIIGPLLHGVAMELGGNNGLMYSISLLFLVLFLAICILNMRPRYGASR